MSTNYYMLIKDKDFVNQYFSGEYELGNLSFAGYEIHIGKRSCGWKPLFEAHPLAYHSVEEMLEFIKNHKSKIKLYDEYHHQLSINDLKEELVDWEKDQESRIIDLKDEGIYTSPIDHLEYINNNKHKYAYYAGNYFHDKDGFDFCEGSFC